MRYDLYCGDNKSWLPQVRNDDRISMIFADPPDNIGLGYTEYKDKLSDDDYTNQLDTWVRQFIHYADTLWISFNSRWLLPMALTIDTLLDEDETLEFKPCVQTFSFYQHNKKDLGNAHRPLWRLRRKDSGLYPEQAKVPSWRQLNGDKRATNGGKVPGDAFDFTKLPEKQRRDWHERAVEIGGSIVDPLIPDDHFDFTRVTGNSKQRRPYHPTQLNEGLVKRCILLSTKPGDLVVDPFAGTGTTLRVCRELGDRCCSLIEIDKTYCNEIAKEHGMRLRENGEKFSRWEL